MEWSAYPSITRGLVAVLLACMAYGDLDAQVLQGRVMEEGRALPISGADVVLLDRDGDVRARVTADEFGRFLLEPPEAGEFYVRAERIGYEPTRSPLLSLSTEGRRSFEILLTPMPVGLEGFEVRVEPEAAEHLQLMGFTPVDLGRRWISREALDETPSSFDMVQAIRWRGVPGVEVKPRGNEGPGLCVMFAPWTRCAAIYFNGVRIRPAEALYLGTTEVDAIAVLRPVEAATFFGTQAGNGVVLMWTRRGGR